MDELQYRQMYIEEDRHWWFLAKRAFVRTMLSTLPTNLKILDIGSGTGGMSAYLSGRGTLLAIEKSPYAIPYLRKRNITYQHRSVQLSSFKPNTFDLICAFDVLYHKEMGNDRRVVRKMYQWLKPGGTVCVTDCAVPLLFSHHDRVMHAAKRYWLSELTAILKKEGFIITKASYIYFFTFPLFVLSRMIDAVHPYNTMKPLPRALNSILITLCFMESYLLRYVNFPIGSSVLIVAKKP